MFPYGLQDPRIAIAALPMVLVPGFLMISTIRFRSIKAIDVGWRRSYLALFLGALTIALIAAHPRVALVALAYTYMLWGVVMFVVSRLRRRPQPPSS
jgi:phosphatidylserine synthase